MHWIRNQIKMALANLSATTLRTLLAMLGILVGTASVVAMVSTGEMATEQALLQFKTLGTDMMAISISTEKTQSEGATESFDLAKAMAIKTTTPLIEIVAPYTLLYSSILYQGQVVNGSIIGATGDLANVVRIKIKEGRFISDFDRYEAFCVIGNAIYTNLTSFTKDPLGTQIRLGDRLFTIIGVAEAWPENSFFYQDINNSIMIPLRASGLLSKYNSIDNIVMRLTPDADINIVQTAITDYMKKIAPDKKLFFRSAKELVKSMLAQRQVFTLLLGAIGSISLLVGGIGVMNIMLVSVLERRQEIGIRLALGAKRSEIQWMFLSEALILSIVGGTLGVVIGVLISFVIAFFANWSFQFYFLPPVVGFTVSVLIGIFFGFYPAKQASQLDPIETLRTA